VLKLDSAIAVSIEDPVEFNVPQVRQVEADPDYGLTFHNGLRALLRMGPDVILVGEMRDRASATSAAQAAASGRFVLATLHAQDVAAAIEIMHFLSVPRHLISGTLRLVIAQNLVRRLCATCSKTRPIAADEKKWFIQAGLTVPDSVGEPVGCAQCNQYGYRGRVGVCETLQTTPELRYIIASDRKAKDLRDRLAKAGAPRCGRTRCEKRRPASPRSTRFWRCTGRGVSRTAGANEGLRAANQGFPGWLYAANCSSMIKSGVFGTTG